MTLEETLEKGIRVSEIQYLGNDLLYYESQGTCFWVASTVIKAIDVVKQVIQTWERRKQEAVDKRKSAYAEWHLEYHRERLQSLIKTRNLLT